MKAYKIQEDETYNLLEEAAGVYMVARSRSGLSYNYLEKLSQSLYALSPKDWASILHVSERTLQRYEKDQKQLPAALSEKLIQVSLLLKSGMRVFEDIAIFNDWLSRPNITLGSVAPKSLLDTHFGIEMIKETLIRIEHGVFA